MPLNTDPVPTKIVSPGTLTLGGANASAMSEIIFGSTTFTFQAAIGTAGSASATGSIVGLSSSFSIIPSLSAQMATAAGVRIEAIACGAGNATATAFNAATASQTVGAAVVNFFAYR